MAYLKSLANQLIDKIMSFVIVLNLSPDCSKISIGPEGKSEIWASNWNLPCRTWRCGPSYSQDLWGKEKEIGHIGVWSHICRWGPWGLSEFLLIQVNWWRLTSHNSIWFKLIWQRMPHRDIFIYAKSRRTSTPSIIDQSVHKPRLIKNLGYWEVNSLIPFSPGISHFYVHCGFSIIEDRRYWRHASIAWQAISVFPQGLYLWGIIARRQRATILLILHLT